MRIRLQSLVKTFNTFRAVRDVSADIASGELVALLGPSGSGKTTILRLVAGLEYAESGRIFFGDTDATSIAVRDRGVGFVFQSYALFPHMTVAENIAFGIPAKGRRGRAWRAAVAPRVDELLRLVRLDGLGERFPLQLSGGQRQRVAFARALAVEPRVLLLDEPFGALDANVRRELRHWLREVHSSLGITTIFVTHDQEEALDLADRIMILNEGRIIQEGTPEELVRRPVSAFVMNFLGDASRFEANVRDGLADLGHGLTVPAPEIANGPAEALVRPADLDWASEPPGLPAKIVRVLYRPDRRVIVADSPSAGLVEVETDTEHNHAAGEAGYIRIRRARVFPPPSS